MQEAYKFIEGNLTNIKTIVTWRPSRDTVKKSEGRDREHAMPCHSLLQFVHWEIRDLNPTWACYLTNLCCSFLCPWERAWRSFSVQRSLVNSSLSSTGVWCIRSWLSTGFTSRGPTTTHLTIAFFSLFCTTNYESEIHGRQVLVRIICCPQLFILYWWEEEWTLVHQEEKEGIIKFFQDLLATPSYVSTVIISLIFKAMMSYKLAKWQLYTKWQLTQLLSDNCILTIQLRLKSLTMI